MKGTYRFLFQWGRQIPECRPYGSTRMSTLRVYQNVDPTGLPKCRPYGSTEMSTLRVYRNVDPTGLPKCRPYGSTKMSTMCQSMRDGILLTQAYCEYRSSVGATFSICLPKPGKVELEIDTICHLKTGRVINRIA